MSIRIHPSADVASSASIGEGTSIWHQCQVREGAILGENCILGRGVFIDTQVQLGNNVKVQNYVSIYHGVRLEDGVFVGPHVCFTNDLRPRSINPDGSLKSADDWIVSETLIKSGASLGANSTIRCGVTIGSWAMVGSGSVVTHTVPDFGLVFGNPARLHGFVCRCGNQLRQALSDDQQDVDPNMVSMVCPNCHSEIQIPKSVYSQLI